VVHRDATTGRLYAPDELATVRLGHVPGTFNVQREQPNVTSLVKEGANLRGG
jgi:hypothetical protein